MSGVATLEARGVKRVFDEMSVDVPTACAPNRFYRPAYKRSRCGSPRTACNRVSVLDAAALRATVGSGSTSASGATAHVDAGAAQQSSAAASPASRSRLSPEEVAALARHFPKRLKRVVERVASGTVAPGEKLFTVEDVREIVTSVVAEREEKLKGDFALVLNDRLAEQFRAFTKFNEDYISRELRGKDLTYLS